MLFTMLGNSNKEELNIPTKEELNRHKNAKGAHVAELGVRNTSMPKKSTGVSLIRKIVLENQLTWYGHLQ